MDSRLSLVELVVAVNDRFTLGGVGHGFGGALALAYYIEEPRTTRDIDVNVSLPIERAQEVFAMMPPGVSCGEQDLEACRRDGQVRLWYGKPRDGTPIDIFFPQHRFHQSVARDVTCHTFARHGYLVPIISAAHLAVFKVLFDRPKDWVDVAAMLAAGSVDIAETRYWLGELLGEEQPRIARFEDLAAEAAAGRVPRPGGEMDAPPVEWSGGL